MMYGNRELASTCTTVGSTLLTPLDCYTSGIPTRTTATLTPTTLRNIEQAFLELQSAMPMPPTDHDHSAGFVPPTILTECVPTIESEVELESSYTPELQTVGSMEDQSERSPPSNIWIIHPKADVSADSIELVPADAAVTMTSGVAALPITSASLMTGSDIGSVLIPSTIAATSVTKQGAGGPIRSGRNMGGRRPNREEQLSPEEEERRRLRRERNKLAAARCRKRRLDHTNTLIQETECLEEKKQSLKTEIHCLNSEKEELELILEAHKMVCKLHKTNHHVRNDIPDIKPDIEQLNEALITQDDNCRILPVTTSSFAQRPNYLPLNTPTFPRNGSMSEVAGISITTPSSGIFNFESILDGGTGLTPVTFNVTAFTPTPTSVPQVPTCATQQRSSSAIDLASPSSLNPPKLVSL